MSDVILCASGDFRVVRLSVQDVVIDVCRMLLP